VNPVLVDTHAHLGGDAFDPDRDEVIARAAGAGVAAILDVGVDAASSEAASRLAGRHASVFSAAGIHPHEASKAGDADLARVESLLSLPKTLALGEIGLDTHYHFSPVPDQKRLFLDQVRLAVRLGKPMIVHVREAMADALDLLAGAGAAPYRGVFHCYGGEAGEIPAVLEMGFHVSFTGVVTFKNFANAAAVLAVPDDRLLLETDSPYMTPAPLRGKRNEPAFLAHTLARLAEMRGTPAATLADRTTANARSLFGFP
jgi:TatD DNase family protein